MHSLSIRQISPLDAAGEKAVMLDPHRLNAFVETRILSGAMAPQARGRMSRLYRHFSRAAILAYAPAVLWIARPHLTARDVDFGVASAFVTLWHRHLDSPIGHLFSVGVFHDGRLCGVAIAGRPVSRHLDNGRIVEITRVATDGTRNACSKLYAAVRKEARRRGYAELITYTLPQEGGASLRAAGFKSDGAAGGGAWSRVTRPRADRQPTAVKQRWRIQLNELRT